MSKASPPGQRPQQTKPKGRRKKKKAYACRDSNSGFPACEAGVITRLDHTRTPRRLCLSTCSQLCQKTQTKAKGYSPTGIRTRVVWVKTTYPDQLDYWGCAPAGNQTRVSSVAGTYTITVLPAHHRRRARRRSATRHLDCQTKNKICMPGLEPGISRV